MQANAVLFDLDGTLFDTSADLVGALNRVLVDHDQSTVPIEVGRPFISSGAAGLIQYGFGLEREDAKSVKLQKQLVHYYRQHISDHTHLFAGMECLLNQLDKQGMAWGIVTSKITSLTELLLKDLNFLHRPHCLVCRDTTAEAKPSPVPLLYACEQLGLPPANTVYIGDAQTDVLAANRSGMPSLVASYGFVPEGADVHSWGADGVIDHPDEIEAYLDFG